MKKSLLIVMAILLSIGFTVSAASDTAILTIDGGVAGILQLHFGTPSTTTSTTSAFSWTYDDLIDGQSSAISLDTIYERSNQSSTYQVAVASDNSFSLTSATVSDTIPYSINYDTTSDVNTNGTAVTTGGTKTSGTGVAKAIALTFDTDYSTTVLPEAADDYTDDLTFTITLE